MFQTGVSLCKININLFDTCRRLLVSILHPTKSDVVTEEVTVVVNAKKAKDIATSEVIE